MSPLGDLLASLWPDAEGATPQAKHRARRGIFTATTLADVTADGFEKTLRRWEQLVRARLPSLDSFSRGRLEELCRAAQEFDAGGSRDVDEFIGFAEAWKVRESASGSAVLATPLSYATICCVRNASVAASLVGSESASS